MIKKFKILIGCAIAMSPLTVIATEAAKNRIDFSGSDSNIIYDFGLINESDGPKEGHVALINSAQEEMVIVGAKTSCGCTDVTYSNDVIAPGDFALIKFVYNPAGRPGKFAKKIQIFMGDRSVRHIMLEGVVLATSETFSEFYPVEIGALRLSADKIYGRTIPNGASRNYFVEACNQSMDSITPEFRTTNPALTVSCPVKKIAPGESTTLKVTYNSDMEQKIGAIESTIVIISDAGAEGAIEKAITFDAKVINNH